MPQDSKAGRDHLSKSPSIAPSGVNWLLIIAIDEYNPAIGKLNNCVRDAQDFRDTLWQRYHFDKNNTIELYNEQATKDAILESFDDLMEKINNDPLPANLVFYYSGHGELMHSRGYWLPADAQKNRRGSYLPNEEVTHFIKSLTKARHVLGIVDACFAGTLFTTRNANDTWQRFYNIPSRCIMTAGRNEVVSDGIPGSNSPFAKSLLTQLTANKNTELSATTLWDKMKEGVVANAKQTPRYEPIQEVGHLGGEFYFHLKQDETRDWEAAQQENTIAAHTRFRRTYPNSIYFAEAKQKIKALEEEEDWQKALRRNRVSDYEDYLDDYPNGSHTIEAQERIDAIANSVVVTPPTPTIIVPKPEIITKKEEKTIIIPRIRTNEIEPEMVFIPGGTFKMGGNDYDDEKPIHEVTVQDFYIGKYPVTQAEWRIVMGSDSPKLHFKGCDLCPVENVSWNNVQDFLKKLNAQTNKQYRLPTEAEWEYSARGGKQSKGFKYAGSNNLDEVGWYDENSDGKTYPVGEKKANELDIYDMSGNVWEWCEDVWHGNYDGVPKDGNAWLIGGEQGLRVVRGGSWLNFVNYCRASSRIRYYSSGRSSDIGFRLARTGDL